MANNFLSTYANEVKNQLDYLVTWPVNADVRLGDVGIFVDGVFKRTGTLKALGIRLPGERDGRGENVMEYGSRNGVEWLLDEGAALVVPPIEAKVEIKFNREGAVFLRMGDYSVKQFESITELGQEVLRLYKEGTWQREQVVVTEVLTAGAATILVSGTSAATASFKLDASLPAAEALSKGRFSGLLGVSGSFAAKIIGQNISPLFRTSGLVRKLITFRTDFRGGSGGELVFDNVDSSQQLQEV